jgi:Tol biopolymer transport system component
MCAMRALALLLVAGCYTGTTPAASTTAITLGEPAPHHHAAFVFVSGREAQDRWSQTQIFLADPSAEHPTNLTNDANWNGSPSISHDGTRMVYVAERSLHVMTLATGDDRAIEAGRGPFGAVRWVGSNLAFVAPASTRGSSIWIVGDHGGDPRRVTDPGATASDEQLASLDHGRGIVFDRYDEATRDRDLWVVDVDGSNLRRLTATPDVAETLPIASHDGRYLAYRAFLSPHEQIRILSLPDGALVHTIVMPDGLTNINGLDFTADDRSIVFGADASAVGGSLENIKGELFSIALDGTHLRRLTKNAAYDGQPAVIP